MDLRERKKGLEAADQSSRWKLKRRLIFLLDVHVWRALLDSSWEINFEARFCGRKVISSALLFPVVPRAPGREQTTVLGDEQPDLGASPCSFPRAKMVSKVLSLEWLYLGSTCYTGCVTLGGLVPLCDNCQPLSRRHRCGFLKIRGRWTGWVSLMMCPWDLVSECESQCFPGQRSRSRQGKRGGGRYIVRKARDQVKRSVLAGAGRGGGGMWKSVWDAQDPSLSAPGWSGKSGLKAQGHGCLLWL